jgi:hypothetical protein
VGLLWMDLAVVFEFSFGHYVVDGWQSKRLNDYDIL